LRDVERHIAFYRALALVQLRLVDRLPLLLFLEVSAGRLLDHRVQQIGLILEARSRQRRRPTGEAELLLLLRLDLLRQLLLVVTLPLVPGRRLLGDEHFFGAKIYVLEVYFNFLVCSVLRGAVFGWLGELGRPGRRLLLISKNSPAFQRIERLKSLTRRVGRLRRFLGWELVSVLILSEILGQ